MGHFLVMLMKSPSLSITAVSASRTDGGRKVAFSQRESHMWYAEAIGPMGSVGRTRCQVPVLALPQNQNYIYFHFPDSWHDAAFVLSQPHHVSTQGVLWGLAVKVTYSISLLCLLLILTFSQGLFSSSCSLFRVPLSAACDSDKVQEWLSKFPFLLINFALPEEKF